MRWDERIYEMGWNGMLSPVSRVWDRVGGDGMIWSEMGGDMRKMM